MNRGMPVWNSVCFDLFAILFLHRNVKVFSQPVYLLEDFDELTREILHALFYIDEADEGVLFVRCH